MGEGKWGMSLNGWNIDVAGAQSVIVAARAEKSLLGAEESVLRNAITAAAESVNSALITGALVEVYEGYLGPLMASGSGRADKVLTQTSIAIQAYIDGDQSMADTATRQAAVAQLSTEPTDAKE